MAAERDSKANGRETAGVGGRASPPSRGGVRTPVLTPSGRLVVTPEDTFRFFLPRPLSCVWPFETRRPPFSASCHASPVVPVPVQRPLPLGLASVSSVRTPSRNEFLHSCGSDELDAADAQICLSSPDLPPQAPHGPLHCLLKLCAWMPHGLLGQRSRSSWGTRRPAPMAGSTCG